MLETYWGCDLVAYATHRHFKRCACMCVCVCVRLKSRPKLRPDGMHSNSDFNNLEAKGKNKVTNKQKKVLRCDRFLGTHDE